MKAIDEFNFAAECVARCNEGFTSEFEWLGWLKKRQSLIDGLAPHLRKRVMAAHTNATAKEFSNPKEGGR